MTTVALVAAFRVALGLLFLAAGGSKALRIASVRHTMQRYRLLPTAVTRVVAPILGPLEALVGLTLALSPWVPVLAPARLVALALLALFSGAIGSALRRGLRIPCGCGLLLGDHVITPATLGRNLCVLTFLALDAALLR